MKFRSSNHIRLKVTLGLSNKFEIIPLFSLVTDLLLLSPIIISKPVCLYRDCYACWNSLCLYWNSGIPSFPLFFYWYCCFRRSVVIPRIFVLPAGISFPCTFFFMSSKGKTTGSRKPSKSGRTTSGGRAAASNKGM